MVLLLLGDSQVERVWPTVRLDREVLRDAIFIPVKNRQAIMAGYQSITAAVSVPAFLFLSRGLEVSLYACNLIWPLMGIFHVCLFPLSVHPREVHCISLYRDIQPFLLDHYFLL